MENKKPLVSICIPTYNRCELLKKNINSIICQKEFKDGLVEVVISDNASDDDTEKVGRTFADKYPNIKYFRNKENCRENFQLVLGRATGILRKLNNDRLLFVQGGLKVLCETAERYINERPVLFFSNGIHGQVDDRILNFHDFVVSESFWVTFIGYFSIWEDECVGIENDLENEAHPMLWQVRKLYEITEKKGIAVVCDKQIMIEEVPEKKDVSYSLYNVFYKDYMEILEPYCDRKLLDMYDIEYLQKDLLYNFFTRWLVLWELKVPNAIFSYEDDLKQQIIDQYKDKEYINDWLSLYSSWKIKARIEMLCR